MISTPTGNVPVEKLLIFGFGRKGGLASPLFVSSD